MNDKIVKNNIVKWDVVPKREINDNKEAEYVQFNKARATLA
jgi:hypothetical protein